MLVLTKDPLASSTWYDMSRVVGAILSNGANVSETKLLSAPESNKIDA